MPAAEPLRDRGDIKKLTDYYLSRGNIRNYLLITLGLQTALRIGDLLRLNWGDVYDFSSCTFNSHIRLSEKKTGKPKSIALSKQALVALQMYFNILPYCGPDTPLFPNNRKDRKPISRVQAYRIIRAAADAANVQDHVSCHSLRKTFGYLAWKAGAPLAVIMEIYNHSSLAVTKRYLGVSQDDKDKLYLTMDFILEQPKYVYR